MASLMDSSKSRSSKDRPSERSSRRLLADSKPISPSPPPELQPRDFRAEPQTLFHQVEKGNVNGQMRRLPNHSPPLSPPLSISPDDDEPKFGPDNDNRLKPIHDGVDSMYSNADDVERKVKEAQARAAKNKAKNNAKLQEVELRNRALEKQLKSAADENKGLMEQIKKMRDGGKDTADLVASLQAEVEALKASSKSMSRESNRWKDMYNTLADGLGSPGQKLKKMAEMLSRTNAMLDELLGDE